MCATSDVMVCPACEGLAVTRGYMAVCTECWWLSPDVRELVAEEPEVVGPMLCAEPEPSEAYAPRPTLSEVGNGSGDGCR